MLPPPAGGKGIAMAAIFPPSDKGGVPPGPNVCNGYTPERGVSGEGPLYVANDCTTVLTDCQLNAVTSEILAAVDRLGFIYDSTRITNLADALSSLFNSLSTGKLNISGGTMTGPLILSGDPTAPLGAVTKQYADAISIDIDADLAAKVSRSGDTMTGPLTLSGPPTAANHAATRAYVDAGDATTQGLLAGKLDISGGTMTGMLTLAGPPVAPNDAATRSYVDQMAGAATGIFLPLAGGAMTGPLTLAGPPTAPLNPVTLQYFNDQMSAAGLYPDAPNDGFAYGRMSQAWQRVVRLDGGAAMTGPLTLPGDPTAALHAAPKQYVDAQVTGTIAGKLNISGGTMTGPLVLAGNPGAALEAAPRQYVDTRLIKTGDTMTGVLNINVTPNSATFAWNVNAGLASVRGDGTAQFSTSITIKATAGNPDPRVSFNNAAGTMMADIYFAQTLGQLTLRSGIYAAWLDNLGNLQVPGAAHKPGGGPWSDVSDARIKDRVADYPAGLDAIRALRPVRYHYLPASGRDSEREHIGLIAQEAEAAMPETVTQAAHSIGDLQFDDMRVLDTGPITFALINAVRELAAANDELRARLDALERKGKR